MADRVAIARTHTPVLVDLWGKEFQTVDLTRSGSKKAAEKERDLQVFSQKTDGDPDEFVAIIGALLDLRLTATSGSAKASTQIRKKWEADELALVDVEDFLRRLGEADQNRPT